MPTCDFTCIHIYRGKRERYLKGKRRREIARVKPLFQSISHFDLFFFFPHCLPFPFSTIWYIEKESETLEIWHISIVWDCKSQHPYIHSYGSCHLKLAQIGLELSASKYLIWDRITRDMERKRKDTEENLVWCYGLSEIAHEYSGALHWINPFPFMSLSKSDPFIVSSVKFSCNVSFWLLILLKGGNRNKLQSLHLLGQ